MPKLKADPAHADNVLSLLRECGYPRAFARSRSDLVTITTSGGEPWPLARLRRVATLTWQLEMPTHTNRWEPTPYRASLDVLVAKLAADFPWAIEEARADPVRT
jgi:hypothetical protein